MTVERIGLYFALAGAVLLLIGIVGFLIMRSRRKITPDKEISEILRDARIIQIVLLGGVFVYIIILIILPYLGFVPPLGSGDFLLTVEAGALGFVAVISVAFGYFLPRWMAKWYKQKLQRLSYVHIFRCALFEAVAIYGFILGIIGAGWQIILPFFVVSAGTLIHTFPTEERWKKMMEKGTGTAN